MIESSREYVAFISYRHKDLDKYVAKKVHTLIERYVIPKELRGQGGKPGSTGQGDEQGSSQDGEQGSKSEGSSQDVAPSKKLGFVFRDEEELPVSSNLTDSIQTALDHSKFLIVICTPNTPESIWVEREISYFLEHHDRAHVIGVLADGTPEESFPKLLTTIYDKDGTTPIGEVEPLAANLTDNAHRFDKKRIKKEAVRLYAALIGCPFDTLWQRDRRYKMRCAIALMALALTVALSFSLSIYLKNLQISARNQQIEEQNARIQKQNEEIGQQNNEIRKQNEEIQEKNADLALREAEAKMREAELLYEKGDVSEAIKSATAAISEDIGREAFGADAEYLLHRALGAGQYDNLMRTTGIIEQERDISEIQVSADSKTIFTMDDRGYVRCYAADDGELLWTGDSGSRSYHFYVTQRKRMLQLQSGILLCCNDDSIAALNVQDGSRVWQFVPTTSMGADFACLSPDEKTLAVITMEGIMRMQSALVLLDAETGEVFQEYPLDELYGENRLNAYGRQNAVFSEDGRYLAGMVYETADLYGCDGYSVFLADLQEGTVRKLYEKQIDKQSFPVYPFAIGMSLQPERESLLLLHYDVDMESVCMEEILWNGGAQGHSGVPLTLPTRDLNGPYACTFCPGEENGAILASCAELTLIYRQGDGKLISSRKYSTAHVLDVQWMDEENYTRTMLTNDGLQYGFYEVAGYAISNLTNKSHLTKLSVSEGYSINHGNFGHCLDPDSVMVILCDDNARRAYIQKPAKDVQVQEADWYEEENGNGYYSLTCVKDDMLLLAEDEGDVIAMKYVNAKSQEVEASYKLREEAFGEYAASMSVIDGLFWEDCDHVSFYYGAYGMKVYSLKEQKLIEALDGQNSYGNLFWKDKSGSTFHAGIASADGNDGAGQGSSDGNDGAGLAGKLLIREGLGELKEVVNKGDKNWFCKKSFGKDVFLRAGANGYVVIGQYANAEAGAVMDSFWVYDVAEDQGTEIADECPGTDERCFALGEVRPVFATADLDGFFRIYDIEKGMAAQKISMPVSVDEISEILLCAEDGVLAVWTGNRKLYLYATDSGELLWQGIFEHEKTDASQSVALAGHVWDGERGRLYFKTSSGAAICVDAVRWKKTADFTGMDALCLATNEIYKMKYASMEFPEETNGILRCPAYTLEELLEKAEKVGKIAKN